ncbi:T9SS type A sorting domain-containing protein [Saccharicrinis sp. FJH62]|uniref:T9SS type A sorting domain-containing protein n=1 Tax=Saccharicrinis sp. FJH62 TaxID=3344657 RepID=UPI0035D3F857
MKTTGYIILITMMFMTVTAEAEDDWNVNPNLYEYSMTITGICMANDSLYEKTPDIIVAAFNSMGECVGKSTSRYYSSMDKYRIPLLIYGNSTGEQITFRAFFPEFNKVIQIVDSVVFEVNDSKGNFKNPVIWYLQETPDSSITQVEDPLLYPNPARDELNIVIPPDLINANYAVMDLRGTMLMEGNLNSEVNLLNISTLPSGYYIIKLSIGKEIRCLKLIRN